MYGNYKSIKYKKNKQNFNQKTHHTHNTYINTHRHTYRVTAITRNNERHGRERDSYRKYEEISHTEYL